MLILAPFPSFQESVKYLPDRYLKMNLHNIHHTLICSPSPPSSEYSPDPLLWAYHSYQLAVYGTYHLLEYVIRKLQIEEENKDHGKFFQIVKSSYANTGLPEWWGSHKIHESHKLYINTKQFYHMEGFIIPPVSLPERKLRLQPVLRQYAKEKKEKEAKL